MDGLDYKTIWEASLEYGWERAKADWPDALPNKQKAFALKYARRDFLDRVTPPPPKKRYCSNCGANI